MREAAHQRWGQVTHFQVSSKSQVPTIKSQASLKSQYKQIKQVKSAAHLKQVKSSPDKGRQVTVSNRNKYILSHDLINFSSEIDFF